MKDCIKEKLREVSDFSQVKAIVDDYINYYNKERYQWKLAKLSPNEYYQFCITGEYPLKINGAGTKSRDSTLDAQRPGSP